jgi:LysR family transcriptional regulator, transcription activator of glutamate synthase operon
MSINFRQLEVFRAVAETRSFTQASHVLFISQSTVSQHIRELEDSLGIKLFNRTPRNVSLTLAGENLLEHCHSIFQMLVKAEIDAKTLKDPYCGKVSFGCASTTLLYHLPNILMAYTRKYPNVELNITGGTIQEIGLQMWSGTLDLALVVPPLSSHMLEKIVLFEESFVIVLPRSHPLSKKQSLHVADLAGERFVLHRRGQNTRKLIDKYLFRERVTPHVAVELAETEAIKAMVARGLGVSVLPESALQNTLGDHGLKTFKIPRKDLRRSLAIVYPRPRVLRPPALALIEMLQAHFQRKPDSKHSHSTIEKSDK